MRVAGWPLWVSRVRVCVAARDSDVVKPPKRRKVSCRRTEAHVTLVDLAAVARDCGCAAVGGRGSGCKRECCAGEPEPTRGDCFCGAGGGHPAQCRGGRDSVPSGYAGAGTSGWELHASRVGGDVAAGSIALSSG